MEAVGGGGQGAAGKEQGISRQERGDYKSRFAEDDHEQDEVDQGTVRGHDYRDVLVEVHDVFVKIKEKLADFHRKKSSMS